MSTWFCEQCGEEHPGPPLCYGVAAPWGLLGITAEDYLDRVQYDGDLCIVDGQQFFVRGLVEIPIIDSSETFAWNGWSSLSKESFDRMIRSWDDPKRAEEPPFYGWFTTLLSPYPSTLNLKVRVENRPPGVVPSLVLEPTDHPLAVEQRSGISWTRVHEIAHHMLHDQ